MYKRVRPHLPQLFRYLVSGGTAAVCEVGTFQMMRLVMIPLRASAFLSSILGTVIAFFLHKHFVFKKKDGTKKQVTRFVILQLFNALAQMEIVATLVTFAGVPEPLAKVIGIGCTVCWNFVLYKIFVYA